MEARRAKTGRSQGLVHDSCARRAEPASLRIQENPEAPATPDLQRGSLLVFSDLFANFFRTPCACHGASGGTSLQAGLPFLVITNECPCCRSFMILRKRRLACVALITCMPKPSLSQN